MVKNGEAISRMQRIYCDSASRSLSFRSQNSQPRERNALHRGAGNPARSFLWATFLKNLSDRTSADETKCNPVKKGSITYLLKSMQLVTILRRPPYIGPPAKGSEIAKPSEQGWITPQAVPTAQIKQAPGKYTSYY